MFGALDISTSALVAQRLRLDVISGNIANAKTILNADGEYEPYRRRAVMLAEGDPASGSAHGVHVARIDLDTGPLQPRYEPNSPHADADGYVYYPNVNPLVEQVNALEAARSYEANIAAAEATKSMVSVALELLA
ncbi:MAG: flagellar basal body rod protein FlgC [Planctomycetota bacterium]|nr:flagellar basal body rod protein FlgC [Planctomycetota bacterium]